MEGEEEEEVGRLADDALVLLLLARGSLVPLVGKNGLDSLLKNNRKSLLRLGGALEVL